MENAITGRRDVDAGGESTEEEKETEVTRRKMLVKPEAVIREMLVKPEAVISRRTDADQMKAERGL